MTVAPQRVRIAALADLHVDATSASLRPLFEHIAERADVLLLCGDLTDYGLADEARILAADLAEIELPVLAVLGNHDYEADQQEEIAKVLTEAGVKMLDGACHVEHGVGFAGVKGFGGGFAMRTLEPWGERVIKQFVQEALDEALKLERALSRLVAVPKIAILHYAPVVGTLEGEPPELFAFLGSGRLEEPLNRYQVKAAFHGHAHRGALASETREGIPVYNVALPLLRHHLGHAPPVRFFELPVETNGAVETSCANQPASAAS
jgi:Icc-related predicted phosphoesterase